MFGKILDVLDKILSFFEDWTLFISVMVALVALFLNVVLRYGFNYTLAWSEELVREVIIFTTFVGCSAAIKNRSMIKIDALVQLVPSAGSTGSQTENTLKLYQQSGHSGFRHDDALLRLEDGGPASGHPSENDHHANPPRIPFRYFTLDGGDDVNSNDPGHVSGYSGAA